MTQVEEVIRQVSEEATLAAAHQEANEVRGLIERLFERLGIKRLVVVDDQKPSPDLAACKTAEAPKKIGSKKLGKDEIFSDWIDDVWGEASEQQRETAYASALRARPDLAVGPLALLSAIAPPRKLSFLDPREWEELEGKLPSTMNETETLVLFDLNLGGGDASEGRLLLSGYLSGAEARRAGILTGEKDPEEELEATLKIQEEIGDTINQPVLLASKALLKLDTCREFVDFLRFSGNAKQLASLKADVLELLIEARGKAGKTFEEQYDLRTLESVVVRSTRVEGAWEVDTLIRIIEGLNRAALRTELLAKGEQLAELVKTTRNLAEFPAIDHEPSRRRARELAHGERVVPGEWINRLGLPVANGDIFEISGVPFVLLMQPCDIAIRDDNRDRPDMATGIKAVPRAERVRPSQLRTFELEDWLLPDDDPHELRLSRPLQLPLAVLDLCVFNSDGQAILSRQGDPIVPPIVPGLDLRFKELQARLVENAKGAPKASAFARHDVSKLGGSANGTGVTFLVRRVGRLESMVATEALNALAGDMSRGAFPHDIERFE